MSILTLDQHGDCDDGTYTIVTVRAGSVSAEVSVEDGIFGRRVVVSANGRRLCSEEVDWS